MKAAVDPTMVLRELVVRAMTPDDLDGIMQVERVIYPFPWSRGNFSDALAADYDAWRFLAEGERLVAYCVLMWAVDEVHLLNLSVVGASQGRGVGERCLRWLADDVHRRGAATLLLEVRPSNRPALRLYERLGLKKIGLRRDYYPYFAGAREDAIVMSCHLPLVRTANHALEGDLQERSVQDDDDGGSGSKHVDSAAKRAASRDE